VVFEFGHIFQSATFENYPVSLSYLSICFASRSFRHPHVFSELLQNGAEPLLADATAKGKLPLAITNSPLRSLPLSSLGSEPALHRLSPLPAQQGNALNDLGTSWSRVVSFTTRKGTAGTGFMGGWQGPGAGLDNMRKWKCLPLSGLELRTLCRPAGLQICFKSRTIDTYGARGSVMAEALGNKPEGRVPE
jgi:hypothetical protein